MKKPAKLTLPKAKDVAAKLVWGRKPFGIRTKAADWVCNDHIALRVRARPRPYRDDLARYIEEMAKTRVTARPKTVSAHAVDFSTKVVKIGRWWFDAEYVAIVEAAFPDAVWHPPTADNGENPALAKVDGALVALVMRRSDPSRGAS